VVYTRGYTNNMNIYELLATSKHKVRVYKQAVSNYIALLLLFGHMYLELISIFMKRINLLLKKTSLKTQYCVMSDVKIKLYIDYKVSGGI
jgi:hypothetical protein